MKLVIVTHEYFPGSGLGDLCLVKLEKENYYAVKHDPHSMFRRPSQHGDSLFDEFGFRYIDRKAQSGFDQVVSIDPKNMIVLQFLFEDVVIDESGMHISNTDRNFLNNFFGQRKGFSLSDFFIKFDYHVSGDHIPTSKSRPRRDWLPENSVYPKKRA